MIGELVEGGVHGGRGLTREGGRDALAFRVGCRDLPVHVRGHARSWGNRRVEGWRRWSWGGGRQVRWLVSSALRRGMGASQSGVTEHDMLLDSVAAHIQLVGREVRIDVADGQAAEDR